ncbi:MAG: class I SAM-dependent methyltransferase [Candidatus Neomarinimicrobiota bacterium]
MDSPQSNCSFRTMAWMFKVRDLVLPREKILAEVGLQPGQQVLDYGCGPGSYTVVAARLVGNEGQVYALDIHPLAIQYVQRKAARQRLTNIETILSDCATGLPDSHIDVAFLYDILHGLSELVAILKELHRVLKPEGLLSVNDHHLKAAEVIARVTRDGLFQMAGKGRWTINFSKAG